MHCIMSIQEAIDLTESTPHLPRLFGPEILGRLPQTGQPRVRRTMLGVIGASSSLPLIGDHSNDVVFARRLLILVCKPSKFVSSSIWCSDTCKDANCHASRITIFRRLVTSTIPTTAADLSSSSASLSGSFLCRQRLAKSCVMSSSGCCVEEFM